MQKFNPFKDDLFTFALRADLKGHTYIELSLNDKLGDLIIFNYSKLPHFHSIFQEIAVISPAPVVLDPNVYNSHKIETNQFEYSGELMSLLTKVISILDIYKNKKVVVFFDSGSLRTFIEKKMSLNHEDYDVLIMKFLLGLTNYIQSNQWEFLLWRNPFKTTYWGTECFSFALNSVNFSELISMDDPAIVEFSGELPDVYTVANTIFCALWGTVGNYKLSPRDMNLSFNFGNVQPQLNKYIVFNLNTGDDIKRQKLEQILPDLLKSFDQTENLKQCLIFVPKLEKEWSNKSVNLLTEWIHASDKKEVYELNAVDYNFYKNAEVIVSICSGFIHFVNVFNSKNITFSLENTNNDINGRNFWAPQESLLIKEGEETKSSLNSLVLLIEKYL